MSSAPEHECLELPDKSVRPLISVVIPAYNAERTIGETLRSVRSQTCTAIEIIVVDDGSTDGTRVLVESLAAEDTRIRLLSQQNTGVAAARNLGWKDAHSDLIAFIDADDLWAPTKLERQLAVMQAEGEKTGLVYTWFVIINQRSRVLWLVKGRDIKGDVLAECFLGNFIGHSSSPLVRRSALIEAGGFDSGLHHAGAHGCEDILLYFRIARRYHFGLVPEYLTGYRVVAGRMSSDRHRMLRSFELVADEMRLLYPESSRSIQRGLRLYVEFLIGEATAAANFLQAGSIYWNWIRRHPGDALRVPLAALWPKISWRLERLWQGLTAGSFRRARQPFPVGGLPASKPVGTEGPTSPVA